MTHASAAPQVERQHDGLAVPLILWLLIQLAAVALAASRVPLSADFPRPAQALAVHEMVIAQVVGSALFLPVLFRGGWRGWLAMVVTAGPMLMLAAWLARTPLPRVLVAWGEVGMWLAMLALWRAALCERVDDDADRALRWRSARACDILRAAALLLSVGGLLLWYLRTEFQPDRPPTPLLRFPLPAILQNLTAPTFDPSPLLSTAALSAAALVILTVKPHFRRAHAH
jgi:hypothetical protein